MSKLAVLMFKPLKCHYIAVLKNFLKPSTNVRGMCKLPERCKKYIESPKCPFITLNNGEKIPQLGLGTWLTGGRPVIDAVTVAVKAGYKMIDTAHIYGNEPDIGIALQECKQQGIWKKREDLFITSKLWNTYHRPDLVEGALCRTLNDLQLEYVDMYLIHWPGGFKEDTDELFPKNECGETLYSDVDYVDTWKAMEELVKHKMTKTIGISNFNKSQIERVLKAAEIPPAMLQVECHPYLNQRKLMDFCKSKNIAVTAYSPLGSSTDRPNRADEDEPRIMTDETINEIACRNKKSNAQVLIRYQLQRGNVVIPRSTNPKNIRANLKVFDWKLSDEDMEELDCLNKNFRYLLLANEIGTHKYYPFNDEY